MNTQAPSARRRFIKIGSAAIASMPLLVWAKESVAAVNANMRRALKYEDKAGPDNKLCSGCLQFIPGKTAADLGSCKLFPGDTEISPKGYCVGWVAKPK